MKLCDCPAEDHSLTYDTMRTIFEMVSHVASPLEMKREIKRVEKDAGMTIVELCPLDKQTHAETRAEILRLCETLETYVTDRPTAGDSA